MILLPYIRGLRYILYVLGCHVFGKDYQGKSNQTIDGTPCQPWSSQTPHRHSFTDPKYYLEGTVEEAGSFCRNPEQPRDGNYDYWVWCYTTAQSMRYGYCEMENYCGEYSNHIDFNHKAFLNTLMARQDSRYFADDVLNECLNENVWISLKIPLRFVPRCPINNIPALVQIMAWRRPGDKPLSEPMLVFVPMHICVTRPQRVK